MDDFAGLVSSPDSPPKERSCWEKMLIDCISHLKKRMSSAKAK